ncbi:hypothetical protein N0V90_005974 [Kalmusia sp. IMI 367209]|nr:hypothetical protein N0V90_005974 [Kalmusia sp. IMI 367209]
MKLLTLFTTQLVTLSTASSHFARQYETGSPHEWIPGGPNDLTKYNAVAALTGGLNFNASLAEIMFDQAIIANPEPNATFFTLDMLNVHNVLEHDASLSRTDAFFGNNHIFNQTVFDTSRAYWTEDVVTANMLANSKIFRQVESRAFNPDYKFTSTTEQFSLGEVAAPIIAFGDIEKFTVPRNLITYFFENERFPTELGWSRKEHVMSLEDITSVSHAIGLATNLLTGSNETSTKLKRGDFHAGMF